MEYLLLGARLLERRQVPELRLGEARIRLAFGGEDALSVGDVLAVADGRRQLAGPERLYGADELLAVGQYLVEYGGHLQSLFSRCFAFKVLLLSEYYTKS